MSQTLKFGRIRASNDPDRDRTTHGTYYGKNWNGGISYSKTRVVYANTRGTWIKRG